ncbi:MAG: futalosine hydrolase [Rubripirellula sp.]
MTDLILVPTPVERDILRQSLRVLESRSCAMQLCGFGPIAAAARASSLIARYKPERVMLVGIAGTFSSERCPIGTAQRFEKTTCYGIGVGAGPAHQPAAQLGWLQFSGGDDQPEIGDTIPLDSSFVSGIPASGMLLTCCSASASEEEADQRRALFPDATAEDMEGYAVAMACSLAGVPLQIVRGISNEVGDRVHDQWQVNEALAAAANLALQLMPRTWLPSPS